MSSSLGNPILCGKYWELNVGVATINVPGLAKLKMGYTPSLYD